MHTYYCHPSLERSEFDKDHGGIRGSLEVHARMLPGFGWREVQSEDEADIVVGYLSTKSERLDVFHLRGLYPTGEMKMARGFWQYNVKIIENIRRARHVICVSEWVADMLRRDMHMHAHVVPGHGMDLERWDEIQSFDAGAPYALWNKTRRHGVCDPRPVLELAKRLPEYQFVTTFLPQGASTPSNVKVVGLQPYERAWQTVKGATVYLATTKETFGRGTLEAMASGCVVVGFRWGATPDVLADCGILVAPGDYDALAEAFQQGLDQATTFAERGRERIAEHFQWTDVVGQTAAVYDLALADLERTGPRISVIVPCFNHARYVTHAIDSVRAQTYPDWELIVVNDGSTDDSDTIIRAAIANEPRARLIEQPNLGVAHARNHGISQAQGEFICCLDADDAIAPAFLTTTALLLDIDHSLGIAYTGIELMDEHGGLRNERHVWPRQYTKVKTLGDPQIPCCCLFRRSWWERLGGYRQRYAPHGAGQEDADFWFRILANGGGAEMVSEEGLFHYRIHEQQTTRVHRGDWEKNTYLAWHPFVGDEQHPFASQLRIPPQKSWPVRNYDCPGISVIIPVGPEHLDCLGDALDSVDAQTYRNWELIVVNDSGKRVDLTAWPFVRLVETAGQKGTGYARNRGTEIARAPLVTYLDADDFLQPTFLARTVEVWTEHQDSWVYTDMVISHSDGRLEDYPVPDWNVRTLWRRGLAGVTSLHTKESWELVGGFDEQSTREDWDFHLRLAKAGICGIHIPEVLYTYRHATGRRRGEGTRRREILVIHETYDQEELIMACTDCDKSKIRRDKVNKSKAASGTWASKTDSGFVNLEYIGQNKNELVFKGPSGRRYRFGNNKYHRTGLVHPGDVQWALRLNCFQVASRASPSAESAPLRAEPVPKPSPVSKEPKPTSKPARKIVDTLTARSKGDTLIPEGVGLDLTIGARSIKELQGMDLTKYDLVTAIRLEEAGKNRKSALTLLARAQRRLVREQRKVTPSDSSDSSEPVDVPSEPAEGIHEETPDEDMSVPDRYPYYQRDPGHVPIEDVSENVSTDETADENIEDTPPDGPTTPEVTHAESVYGDYTITE